MSLTVFNNAHSLIRKLHREKERLVSALHRQHDEEIADSFFNFSATAYHIKDWLKNQPEFSNRYRDVEGFVESCVSLRICKDICNSQKHFRVDRDSVTKEVRFDIASVERVIPGERFVDVYGTIGITIEAHDGMVFECQEFCEAVIKEWEDYVSKSCT